MQTVILYRYKRADGGYSVSPNRPEGEYETRVRLIADEGKALTDGKVVTQCTDAEVRMLPKRTENVAQARGEIHLPGLLRGGALATADAGD